MKLYYCLLFIVSRVRFQNVTQTNDRINHIGWRIFKMKHRVKCSVHILYGILKLVYCTRKEYSMLSYVRYNPTRQTWPTTVLFQYLVKSDLSSARHCTIVHWTSHFLQGTRTTRPWLNGNPIPPKTNAFPLAATIEWKARGATISCEPRVHPGHNVY